MLRTAVFILAGIIAIAVIGSYTSRGIDPDAGSSGKLAPELTVNGWLNVSGPDPTLATYRGKVVVLDFWAYW